MNKDLLRFKIPIFTLYFLLSTCVCFAQTLAPGAPGKDAQWATAGKQAVGTSASLESKVWFTLANGVMTEVYYPDVTVANVHLLQIIGVDGGGNTFTEQDDTIHDIKVLGNESLSFQQINTAKTGSWRITKTYTTDIKRNTVLIDIKIEKLTDQAPQFFYVYYDPSLNNSGMHDTAWTQDGALLSKDGEVSSALAMFQKQLHRNDEFGLGRNKYTGFVYTNNGFLGTTGGTGYYTRQFKSELLHPSRGSDLRDSPRAENGNVTQTGSIFSLIEIGSRVKVKEITLALGFAKTPEAALKNAKDSLQDGFTKTQAAYDKQWSDYVKTLPKVDPKYQSQFNMAAMILKAFEDKTNRGANIASLSKPWGGAANANEVGSSGYHAVWARDLYQVATAFMALGDKDAANRALDFLFKIQQKPDGSFPQNSWIDGKPIGGSLQMDQVGFPLILAHELGRFDQGTYQKHIKPSADFIVRNGPTTPQERWEEKGGYSPSTIAAEIAGLVCAAEIAKKNNDLESANRWLKTADDWQQNVEKWTVTTTGKHSKLPYYVRLTQNGKPDAGEKYEINGVYGMVDERDIVDAGFLELVRLGIKSPDDKIIQNSIKVVDQVIRVNTPNGEGFYRYNFDSYGEPDNGQRWNFDGKYTGKGRLWALLSGERGQYELAFARYYEDSQANKTNQGFNPKWAWSAKSRLDAMQNFANDGLMIPEQVWDSPKVPKNIDRQFIPELKLGEGTGSATPLAWSMAQFIRLAVNLKEGRNLDTPKVVYNRYVLGKKEEVKNDSVKLISDEKQFPAFTANSNCYYRWAFNQSGRTQNVSPRFWGNDCVLIQYFGDAKKVEIAGDFTGWKPENFGAETKIFSFNFKPTARVEYKFIVDGKWITDPLNPNKVDNGVGGENSFFTMPDYKATTWDKDDDNRENFLDIYDFKTEKLNGVRFIQVYVPKECVKLTCPTLYVQDGGEYIEKARSIQIQQNLVKANKIKPFIIVFLHPKDRMKEYWANDDYAKFLAEEVVPMIDSKYKTDKSRDGRAVMGASLGGITAVNVGLKYPQIFSRIGGQSSSFWIDNKRIVKDLEKLDGKTKFTFYLDDGSLEGPEDSRSAADLLRKKGFEVTYIEGEAGHNWTAWRDRLADAFIAIWK